MTTKNTSSFELNFNKEMSKELLDMDLDKIRECLEVLINHEALCEQEHRFVEAGIAKERIKQFKELEEQKMYSDLVMKHQSQLEQLEIEQNEELFRHNQLYDSQLIDMNSQFELANLKLADKQEKELKEAIDKSESTIPLNPKPSTELIQLTKTMEGLAKAKDYAQAHLIQVKILKLSDKERANWEKTRNQKIEAEINKVKSRHANETKTLHLKMSSMFDEFKKRRALDFDNLVQKYKNKHRDLEKSQGFEMTKFKSNQVKTAIHKSSSMTRSAILLKKATLQKTTI